MIDRAYLANLFRRHAKTVYRVGIAYGFQPADCEDLVQESFIRLMQAQPIFRDPEHEKAWLIVTAGNICKDYYKSKQSQELPLEDWDRAVEPQGESEILYWVKRLPERLRLPVHLTYFEGYNSQEIGQMLNINPASARRQLVEARAILREKLEGGKYGRQ